MASYALPSHVAGNDSKRKAFQVQGVEAPPGKQSRLARQANSGQVSSHGPDNSSWASFSRVSFPTSQDYRDSSYATTPASGGGTDEYLMKLLRGSQGIIPPFQQQLQLPVQPHAHMPPHYPVPNQVPYPFHANHSQLHSSFNPSLPTAWPMTAAHQLQPLQQSLRQQQQQQQPQQFGPGGQALGNPSAQTVSQAKERLGTRGFAQARSIILRHQDLFMEQLHELHRIVSRQKRLTLVCENIPHFHAELGRLESEQHSAAQQPAQQTQQSQHNAELHQHQLGVAPQAQQRSQHPYQHLQQPQPALSNQQACSGYSGQQCYGAAAPYPVTRPTLDPLSAWMGRHYPDTSATQGPAAATAATALQGYNPLTALLQAQQTVLAPQQAQQLAPHLAPQMPACEPQRDAQVPASWWSDPRWVFAPAAPPAVALQCAGGAAMPAGVGSPAAKRDESSPTPPCQTPDSQQHSQHPKQRHKQHKGGIRAVDQSQLEPARVQSAEAMRKTGCGISAFTAIPKKPPQAAPQPEAPAPAQLQCESIGSEASKSSLEGSGGNSTAAPNADPRHDSGELSGSKPPAWVPKQTAAAAGLLLSLSRHSM